MCPCLECECTVRIHVSRPRLQRDAVSSTSASERGAVELHVLQPPRCAVMEEKAELHGPSARPWAPLKVHRAAPGPFAGVRVDCRKRELLVVLQAAPVLLPVHVNEIPGVGLKWLGGNDDRAVAKVARLAGRMRDVVVDEPSINHPRGARHTRALRFEPS